MTKQELLHSMCLELSQADLKAIGQSRGFDSQTVGSRELLQHVFFSEQGVQAALASLTEPEVHGLHLLNCLGQAVELDFFKPVYPGLVPAGYYRSFTESHRAIFHQIKTQLVRRGILLCGALPKGFDDLSVLERTRLIFPEEFAVFLPAPFRPRPLPAATAGHHRGNILRDKLKEISQADAAPSGKPERTGPGQWRLADGELLFGGKPFRMLQLEAWWLAQVDLAVSYKAKEQSDALQPVPLLRYAFSRLRENEWLAPDDLLPLWKMALPGPKAPTPRTVCEAGYEWGCFERIEQEGDFLYRQPSLAKAVAKLSPEDFLEIGDVQVVGIDLERVPFEALEMLAGVSRMKLAEGALTATPDLLRLSHASAEMMVNPVMLWLQERHPAFRNTRDTIQQRRGKVLIHQNLLLARVSDLSLKVMLEKKFGEPGQLVSLSKEFVAFPNGLMPEIRAWLKKSGHVVKSIDSGEVSAAET
jgi:hypothetical protein